MIGLATHFMGTFFGRQIVLSMHKEMVKENSLRAIISNFSKTLIITVQLQPHQYDFLLITQVANYFIVRLHINYAVRCIEAGHSSMRTLLSLAGGSLPTLMGYKRNHSCALPSPSPFPYVMARIVPATQLAAHAKIVTLYGRSYDLKLLSFHIGMGLRYAP